MTSIERDAAQARAAVGLEAGRLQDHLRRRVVRAPEAQIDPALDAQALEGLLMVQMKAIGLGGIDERGERLSDQPVARRRPSSSPAARLALTIWARAPSTR